MVKPPLRRKSIGFKVSEEEYAQLETAAQTSGWTLGEWCRQVVLASASDAERHDPALAEIVGMRLLLVNVGGWPVPLIFADISNTSRCPVLAFFARAGVRTACAMGFPHAAGARNEISVQASFTHTGPASSNR